MQDLGSCAPWCAAFFNERQRNLFLQSKACTSVRVSRTRSSSGSRLCVRRIEANDRRRGEGSSFLNSLDHSHSLYESALIATCQSKQVPAIARPPRSPAIVHDQSSPRASTTHVPAPASVDARVRQPALPHGVQQPQQQQQPK